MFSSLRARKVVRVIATSATAGTAMALLFLGGPAEAATMITLGRGYL